MKYEDIAYVHGFLSREIAGMHRDDSTLQPIFLHYTSP
jgi:hypothetical protein